MQPEHFRVNTKSTKYWAWSGAQPQPIVCAGEFFRTPIELAEAKSEATGKR
jgi:hypothetical protein